MSSSGGERLTGPQVQRLISHEYLKTWFHEHEPEVSLQTHSILHTDGSEDATLVKVGQNHLIKFRSFGVDKPSHSERKKTSAQSLFEHLSLAKELGPQHCIVKRTVGQISTVEGTYVFEVMRYYHYVRTILTFLKHIQMDF